MTLMECLVSIPFGGSTSRRHKSPVSFSCLSVQLKCLPSLRWFGITGVVAGWMSTGLHENRGCINRIVLKWIIQERHLFHQRSRDSAAGAEIECTIQSSVFSRVSPETKNCLVLWCKNEPFISTEAVSPLPKRICSHTAGCHWILHTGLNVTPNRDVTFTPLLVLVLTQLSLFFCSGWMQRSRPQSAFV